MLRQSQISKKLFLEKMLEQLDLPASIVRDEKGDIDKRLKYVLNELFPLIGREGKSASRVGRFLGFKTTMGVDHYPHSAYGMHGLFEPSTQGYSSRAFTEPCLV